MVCRVDHLSHVVYINGLGTFLPLEFKLHNLLDAALSDRIIHGVAVILL